MTINTGVDVTDRVEDPDGSALFRFQVCQI